MTEANSPPFLTRRQIREAEARGLRLGESGDVAPTESVDSTPTGSVSASSSSAPLISDTPGASRPRVATLPVPSVVTESVLAAAVPAPARPVVETYTATSPWAARPLAPLPVSTVREVTAPVQVVEEQSPGEPEEAFETVTGPITLPGRVEELGGQTFPVTIAPRGAKVRPVVHKTLGQRVMTWTVMVSAPLLFIGVSMPVNLFYRSVDVAPAIADDSVSDDPLAGQAFIVDSGSVDVQAISRESWSVTSYAEVLRSRYGGRSYNYTVGSGGAIRWPFPVAVPISSGFGTRIAPCRSCSSYHRGVDFLPGNGAPAYAMASGVVTQSEYSGGYGQHVYIEHQIGGQSVITVYAHLQRDSSPLRVGDAISVGDFVGLVGNTGQSTGPHLHFEVRVDGVYVDPFAYLTANAG